MTTPKVSVVTATWRPGGIDILFAGMKAQTYKDFELILVDRRYERRHDIIRDYAKKIGLKIPIIHSPEWRRQGKWSVANNAWNTAFMLAKGEIVIMLLDYTYTPPNWIENHIRHHNEWKTLAMAPHQYMTLPEVAPQKPMEYRLMSLEECTEEYETLADGIFDEITMFKKHFTSDQLKYLEALKPPHQDPKLNCPSGPTLFSNMHCKNDSFLLETILAVNGIDEHYDLSKGPSDMDLGFRIMSYGCKLILDRDNLVYCLNPRPYMPTMAFGTVKERVEDRLSSEELFRYRDRRVAEIQGGGSFKAPNDYELRDKREELWKAHRGDAL